MKFKLRDQLIWPIDYCYTNSTGILLDGSYVNFNKKNQMEPRQKSNVIFRALLSSKLVIIIGRLLG